MITLSKRLFLLVCTAVIVIVSVWAIKSGIETGRNTKYKVEYSDYIVKYASENGLDPYLVMGVIRQESNYIADARSPYAGGLMQLTEVTALEYGSKLGLSDYDYMDPETNIRIGCYLLRCLIDKYDGEVNTALAAYNAGVSNVDAWLSDGRYSRDGKTLYNIPYSETKHYIDKVNMYADKYKDMDDL